MCEAGSKCSPVVTGDNLHVWLERYLEMISKGRQLCQDLSRLVRYRNEMRYVTTAAETNSCEQVYEETLQARKGRKGRRQTAWGLRGKCVSFAII